MIFDLLCVHPQRERASGQRLRRDCLLLPPPPREGRLAGVRALSKLFAGPHMSAWPAQSGFLSLGVLAKPIKGIAPVLIWIKLKAQGGPKLLRARRSRREACVPSAAKKIRPGQTRKSIEFGR